MLQRFQEFATIHILIRRQPIMQSGCRFPGMNGNEFGEIFLGWSQRNAETCEAMIIRMARVDQPSTWLPQNICADNHGPMVFPQAVYMARILEFEDTIYRHPNRITPGCYLAKSRFELAQN